MITHLKLNETVVMGHSESLGIREVKYPLSYHVTLVINLFVCMNESGKELRG